MCLPAQPNSHIHSGNQQSEMIGMPLRVPIVEKPLRHNALVDKIRAARQQV